jgi:alpha-glucosidase (family GH31 glycosyl hydrolase)
MRYLLKRRESLMLDFTFPSIKHLFGLPERSSSFLLEEGDYHCFSVDKFPHEEESPENLYSGIPYLLGHSSKFDSSIMWINAADTFVSINSTSRSFEGPSKTALFSSEAGVIEFFILTSTVSPHSISTKLAKVSGLPYLPPIYALGFHYSKWE